MRQKLPTFPTVELLAAENSTNFVCTYSIAVIPRVTSNAAFHNIFWSVTLHEADVRIYILTFLHYFRTLFFFTF